MLLPLMLVSLALWHYRLKIDIDYLMLNFGRICRLLDTYRCNYEKDSRLMDLDKWCVVEWTDSYRDGYDVDLSGGKICHEPHVVMNAHYIEAIRNANLMACELGMLPYRDISVLVSAFNDAFYDVDKHLFKDSLTSSHISYIGNVFPFAYMLCPGKKCELAILDMIRTRGITEVSMFGAFPLLQGLLRRGENELVRVMLKDEGAWLRILREDGKLLKAGERTQSQTLHFFILPLLMERRF